MSGALWETNGENLIVIVYMCVLDQQVRFDII